MLLGRASYSFDNFVILDIVNFFILVILVILDILGRTRLALGLKAFAVRLRHVCQHKAFLERLAIANCFHSLGVSLLGGEGNLDSGSVRTTFSLRCDVEEFTELVNVTDSIPRDASYSHDLGHCEAGALQHNWTSGVA